MSLSYVLPVHNEETVLEASLDRLASRLAREPGAEILLVENGSRDRSWELCETLAGTRAGVPVHAFREASAGLGHAYHRGLVELVALHGSSHERFAVLTAADLPFGFSDLESFAVAGAGARLAIGSKAHPESRAETGVKRKVMSALYRGARRAVLGMRVGDSQGSLFLRLDLAAELLPRVVSRNFFYTTEVCFFAERAGERIRELPVVLEEERRTSTVKPWRDGTDMARQLVELRSRR